MDVMEPSQLSLQHQESELMSQERTSAHLAPPGSALVKINWVKNEKNLSLTGDKVQIRGCQADITGGDFDLDGDICRVRDVLVKANVSILSKGEGDKLSQTIQVI